MSMGKERLRMDFVEESTCEGVSSPFSLVFVFSGATFTCYSQAAPSMVKYRNQAETFQDLDIARIF